jgi:uncharacterized protein YfaP (DUF2135 family)
MDHSIQPLHVISYDGDHYWWGELLFRNGRYRNGGYDKLSKKSHNSVR